MVTADHPERGKSLRMSTPRSFWWDRTKCQFQAAVFKRLIVPVLCEKTRDGIPDSTALAPDVIGVILALVFVFSRNEQSAQQVDALAKATDGPGSME